LITLIFLITFEKVPPSGISFVSYCSWD